MRLIEETDTDPQSRMASLLAERKRVDLLMDELRRGHFKTIDEEQALERTREIISLAGELIADFHSVRDDFEYLNRDLRERIMDDSGSRGDVLENLFASIDVIAESESGRTFHAFWRLLTDPEQNPSWKRQLNLNEAQSRSLQGRVKRVLFLPVKAIDFLMLF